MAEEVVSLPEISVGPPQAPDAGPSTPVGNYDFSRANVSTNVANGSMANTPVQSTNTQEQTQNTLNTLSNGDLPWAKVALPTTSAGQGGLGEGRHGLKPETWVYGIFLDGDSCQQPLVLGVISGGPGGAYSGNGGSGNGTGSGSGSGEGGDINTNVSGGGDNAIKCAKILVQNGFSPQNAAGIMGNLLVEGVQPGGNGDLNPTQREIGNSGKGYGIAQWTNKSRKDGLMRVAGSQYNTIEGQTKFLIYELRTSEKSAARLLANARNDVVASTKAFMNFERPRDGFSAMRARYNNGDGVDPSSQNFKKRVAKAQAFYRKFMSQGASSSTPSTPAANNTPVTPAMNTPTS